jgi:hypothetical protein
MPVVIVKLRSDCNAHKGSTAHGAVARFPFTDARAGADWSSGSRSEDRFRLEQVAHDVKGTFLAVDANIAPFANPMTT